jgi:hypothetical protein
MKALRLLFCGLMVFATSCSSVYDVQFDYDTKADFSNLKKYEWLPIPETVETDKLTIMRIKYAVDTQLGAKGLRKTSNNPDFHIATHVGSKDKVRVTNWGYGYAPYGRYGAGYGGSGGVDVHQYEEGSLILDFVDPKSKNLIWRGSVKAQIDSATTPKSRDNLINEAVTKILKNFPPPP